MTSPDIAMLGIGIDARAAQEGAEQFARSMSSIKQAAGQTASGIAVVDAAFRKLGEVMAGVLSVYAVTNFARTSIAAFAEMSKAVGDLEFSLHKAGMAIADIGSAIEKTKLIGLTGSVFGGDQAVAALQKLTSLTHDYQLSMAALQPVMDLAAGRQLSFEAAANMVGRALSGNAMLLRRFIPDLREGDGILQQITEHFGGAAANQMRTFGGQTQVLGNYWHDFKQAVGEALVTAGSGPTIIERLIAAIKALTQWVENHREQISDLATKTYPLVVRAFGAIASAAALTMMGLYGLKALWFDLAAAGAKLLQVSLQVAGAFATGGMSLVPWTAVHKQMEPYVDSWGRYAEEMHARSEEASVMSKNLLQAAKDAKTFFDVMATGGEHYGKTQLPTVLQGAQAQYVTGGGFTKEQAEINAANFSKALDVPYKYGRGMSPEDKATLERDVALLTLAQARYQLAGEWNAAARVGVEIMRTQLQQEMDALKESLKLRDSEIARIRAKKEAAYFAGEEVKLLQAQAEHTKAMAGLSASIDQQRRLALGDLQGAEAARERDFMAAKQKEIEAVVGLTREQQAGRLEAERQNFWLQEHGKQLQRNLELQREINKAGAGAYGGGVRQTGQGYRWVHDGSRDGGHWEDATGVRLGGGWGRKPLGFEGPEGAQPGGVWATPQTWTTPSDLTSWVGAQGATATQQAALVAAANRGQLARPEGMSQEEFEAQTQGIQRAGFSKGMPSQSRLAKEFEQIWRNSIKNVQNLFGNFFTDIATNGISSFGDFTKKLLNLWLSMISQMLAARLTLKLFGENEGVGGWFWKFLGLGANVGTGMLTMSPGAASAMGEGLGDVPLASTPIEYQHSGGIVGMGVRMHRGGYLASDEVPAILRRGETVLPVGATAGGKGGQPMIVVPQTFNLNFTALDTQGLHEMLQANKHSVGLAAAAAVQRSSALRAAFAQR